MFAFARSELLKGHVSHFKPFEFYDANEFIAMLPDLTLSKS